MSAQLRIIPRLDIKSSNLIKGVQLEGLRVVGSPEEYAKKYYLDGADEIIYVDAVASLYGRNNILEVVARTASQIFVPLTVGGGVRCLQDVEDFLFHGADKVCVNTASIHNPNLISEIAKEFGTQCCVVEVQAKCVGNSGWTALTEYGRENAHIDAVLWAKQAADLGAGELLITSVDRDGTGSGMDLELIQKISSDVSVPVIAGGGFSGVSDVKTLVEDTEADAVAIADYFHFEKGDIRALKEACNRIGVVTRT